MIAEVDLQTFQDLLPRQNTRGIYAEDESEFILLQSLDAIILKTVVSKDALFFNMKADMERSAADAARAQGLQVDNELPLPSDEEILRQATEKFRNEELDGLKKVLRIEQPQLTIRGL